MNVLICPTSGIVEFNSLSAGSSSFDSSSSGVQLYFDSGSLKVFGKNQSNLNRLEVVGTEGELFSVSDTMSGQLFAVNDFVGLPLFEVYNDSIKIGDFNKNILVVSGQKVGIGTSTPSYTLDVRGHGEFNSIGFSGRSSTFPSAQNGDIWFDSGNNVLRTYISNSNRTIGVAKTFATFTAYDHFRTTGAGTWAPSGTRNGFPIIQYDEATRQRTQFIGIVPSGICLNSGITSRIFWMAASATSGSVSWALQFERMVSDLDTDSFDVTISSGTFNTNATAGIPNISTIPATAIDNIVEGDLFRVRLTRLADVSVDTMAGNAEFIMLELQATL